MSGDLLEPPIYDGKESMNSFLMRAKDYAYKVKEQKSNKIIEFINAWLGEYKININSLSEFKNINYSTVMENARHNKKTYKKFHKSLSKYFEMSESEEEDISTESIEEEKIINLLRHVLRKIDYSLIKKEIGGKIKMTIKVRA